MNFFCLSGGSVPRDNELMSFLLRDGANTSGVAGLLPMIASFQRAFRVHQNVGDVLNVANLALAFTHFQKRIVFGGFRIGRIKVQAMGKGRTPTGGQ